MKKFIYDSTLSIRSIKTSFLSWCYSNEVESDESIIVENSETLESWETTKYQHVQELNEEMGL